MIACRRRASSKVTNLDAPRIPPLDTLAALIAAAHSAARSLVRAPGSPPRILSQIALWLSRRCPSRGYFQAHR